MKVVEEEGVVRLAVELQVPSSVHQCYCRLRKQSGRCRPCHNRCQLPSMQQSVIFVRAVFH